MNNWLGPPVMRILLHGPMRVGQNVANGDGPVGWIWELSVKCKNNNPSLIHLLTSETCPCLVWAT